MELGLCGFVASSGELILNVESASPTGSVLHVDSVTIWEGDCVSGLFDHSRKVTVLIK